jgi:hypothetical protein
LDLTAGKLAEFGAPEPDFPVAAVEKNWVFFSHRDEVYCLYSFHPYRLLRARAWPGLDLETVVNEPLTGVPPQLARGVRNSINPVDYDETHLLHIVHCVYAVKQYAFWAVLISKETLRPVAISARPLVRGWESAPAAIIYVCSAIASASEILIFGGINDSSIGSWRVPRADLDSEWVPLENSIS